MHISVSVIKVAYTHSPFSLLVIPSPPREQREGDFCTVHTTQQGALSTSVPSASWQSVSFKRSSVVYPKRPYQFPPIGIDGSASGFLRPKARESIFLFQGSHPMWVLVSVVRPFRLSIPRPSYKAPRGDTYQYTDTELLKPDISMWITALRINVK